jgi:hypothetical protein
VASPEASIRRAGKTVGRLRIACAALLAAAEAGCVVQSQYQNGQLVSRSVGVGVARLPECDRSTSTLVATSALGAGVGSDSLQLGYVHSEWACIPLECKAVFWVDDPATIEEVRRLIGDDEQLCVADDSGEVVR